MEIKLTNAYIVPTFIVGIIGKRLLKILMKTFIFLICTTVFSLTPVDLVSQNTKIKIDEDKTVTVDEVFKIIKSQTKDYMFIYPEDLFSDFPKVQLKKGVIAMDKLINQSLTGGNLNVILTEDNTILIKEANPDSYRDQQQVTGKVTDEKGMPVAGATVLIKGTTRGTATDFDGSYTITVPNPENVLVFSALGFATQEITVGSQSVINITLKEQVSELGEVVLNAGYYNVKQREATGSISQVTAKEIEKQPVTNPLQALQGRMPGVVITQTSGLPGSGMKIQIRGQNSLRNWNPQGGESGGNFPLYVINGVPVASEPIYPGGEFLSVSAGGIDPLATINPSDIESVEILKDADATAIYGSRGANGVVLITTKKGKSGKLDVDLQVTSSVGTVSKMMDVMNTQQYLAMRNEAFANDGLTPGASDYDLNGSWDQNVDHDWQELLIGGTANMTNYQLALSGGSDLTTFRFGGSFHKETTVFPGDFGYKKGTGFLNLNHNTADNKFKLTLSATYGVDNNDLFSWNIASYAVKLPPNAPIYDDNGNLDWTGYSGDNRNPFSYFEESHNIKTNNLITNAFLSYSILKGLDISASLGYNDISTNQLRTTPQTALNPASGSLNNASKIDYSVKNWIVEPQLTYKTQFGKSELNVLLGTTWQANDTKNFRVRGEGFVSDGLLGNIQAATTQNIDADNETQYRYNAAYGRIGYSFDGKYFLNLTGRRDGSSRFGADKQWGNFGAVGGAWIFSRENGIKVSEWLSFGKLRGSYGTTGNDQIGDYGYLSTYSPGSTTYDGLSFLNTTGLANPAYSWEVNKKLEASLDLGLFKDRIQFNTTWYRNRSSSQLVGFNLPAITGFSSVQANLPATVQNTGWEFSLSTTNIQTAHLNWKTSFNLTIPRNKLVSYPGIEESSYANTYVVGEPLNIRKVYQFDGVDPDTGLYQVVDLNNDGSINTEDQQIVIDRSRKFFGGFYNQFSYKGFDLNFLLEFVKQDAAGIMGLFFTQPGGRFQNQLASILDDDRWTQVGDESTLQKFTTGSSTPYSRAGGSDINVTDASFIRLKNIALSYNMPNNILEKLNIKEMQIYLQAQNLYTITNYFGFNPESPFLELPPLRIVGAGVKLNF